MIITLKDSTTKTIETESDDFKKIIDGTYFNQQGTQNKKPITKKSAKQKYF